MYSMASGIDGARHIYAELIGEPMTDGIKFRYEKEGRLSSRVAGESNIAGHKTFPTVKIHGYQGEAWIVVSLVAASPPYYPHPHKLAGKSCADGVFSKTFKNPEMICSFPDLRMQCVKRRGVKESLALRATLQVDPFGTGFSHSSHPKKINYNAVRLCYQIFLPDLVGNFCIPLAPVLSPPIVNKTVCDLTIMKLSHCSAPVSGEQEVILLCGQVKKDDIEIIFFEENEKGVVWSAPAIFKPEDVHRKCAIIFKTPAYRDPNIRKEVKCFICLKQPSDGIKGKPREFILFPARKDIPLTSPAQGFDPEGIAQKKRKFEILGLHRLFHLNYLPSINSDAVNLLDARDACFPSTSVSILASLVNCENTSLPTAGQSASTVNAETALTSQNIHQNVYEKPVDEQTPFQKNVKCLQDDRSEVPAADSLENISNIDIDFNSNDLIGRLSGMSIDTESELNGIAAAGLISQKIVDKKMQFQGNVRQDGGSQSSVANTQEKMISLDLCFSSNELDGNLSGMTIDSISESVGLTSIGLIDSSTLPGQIFHHDTTISVFLQATGNGA